MLIQDICLQPYKYYKRNLEKKNELQPKAFKKLTYIENLFHIKVCTNSLFKLSEYVNN